MFNNLPKVSGNDSYLLMINPKDYALHFLHYFFLIAILMQISYSILMNCKMSINSKLK